MSNGKPVDYYDVLQVSPTAEPETIHRVYRLLAQRLHPDNRETGNESRFRAMQEAYDVLSNPEKRARYDIAHQGLRQDKWRLVSNGARAENDFDIEQLVRLTLLEVLYTRRRMEPGNPGVYSPDLEEMLGRPREHLEFTIWYLVQKKLLVRDDNSRLTITAEGVEYLEKNYEATSQRKRLQAAPSESTVR
ncbi:MAG: DnaJ domain-containing protein [Vicinamibacterales bacterium]